MIARSNPLLSNRFEALSRGAAVAVILSGVLVLAGWTFHVALLKSVLSGAVAMKADTALAFILSGIALWVRQHDPCNRRVQWIAHTCSWAVATIGLVTLAEYLTSWNPGLDRWLFREAPGAVGNSFPVRMAPVTALNFLLLGMALWLLDFKTRNGYRPMPYLVLSAAGIALLALTRYPYGVRDLYGFSGYTHMALHTALTFLVLCAGLVFARPSRALTGLLISDSVAGVLLRRLLPAALLLPLLIGWLRIQGQRLGYYDTEFGVSLTTLGTIVLFAVLVRWGAGLVQEIDIRQRKVDMLHAGILDISSEAILALDASQRIILFNRGAEQIFGYRAQEVIGRTHDLLLPARFSGAHQQQIREFAVAPETARRMGERREILGRRKDGTEFPAEASIAKLDHDGEITFTTILRDVTDRKRVADALRDSEEQLRQITENIREVFWMSSVDKQQMHFVSPAYETIWGRTRESLYQQPESWLEAVHSGDRGRVKHAALTKQVEGTYDEEYRITRPDGSLRWIRDRAFPIRDASGQVVRVTGIAEDITERQRTEDLVQRLAYFDSLTELPNRNMLYHRLRSGIRNAASEKRSLALIIMDLDHFKEINDTLGHHRGDVLVQHVGRRIREALWDQDFVARLGGDEFAVLFSLAGPQDADRVIGKVLKALESPCTIDNLPIIVEASMGVALYPDHGEDADTLMQRADVAMYVTKKSGLGYTVYDPGFDQYSPQRLALMGELRHAIEHDELVLYYQPRISLKTARIVGVEALVRWRHPYRGMIQPDQFIGPAERTGLIKPLSMWVVKTAEQQCAVWTQAGRELSIAVNLSARNLHDPHFPSFIEELLRARGGVTHCLELEITESAIMTDPARALAAISHLKPLGVTFAIDDFGTGYSSLTHLRKLPVNAVKIDRSFVINMPRNESDAVIVRSTIELARNLGLHVVAEGVENQETYDRLVSWGCDEAQGYYMGRPMPIEDLDRWLIEAPWGLRSARH